MKSILTVLLEAVTLLMAKSSQIQMIKGYLKNEIAKGEDPIHWPVNDCSSFSCMDITDLIFSNKPTVNLEFNFTVITFCL